MPYDPFGKPPKRAEIQGSVLWTLQKNDHTYTCELTFWEDGGGTEAQILKDGDLLVSRRFEEGWQTLQWAERRNESTSRKAASERLPYILTLVHTHVPWWRVRVVLPYAPDVSTGVAPIVVHQRLVAAGFEPPARLRPTFLAQGLRHLWLPLKHKK
jgi:hypothetical protein